MYSYAIRSVCWFALLAACVSTAQADLEHYSAQSEPAHSFIAGWGGEIITDTEFAQIAAPAFMLDGGNQKFTYGATFFFQQCYSGGMLDDLEDAMGPNVPWVGATAAPHNRVSWGDGSNSFWTYGLSHEALYTHDSMLGIGRFARVFDPAGPDGYDPEIINLDDPQYMARNPGGSSYSVYDDHVQKHTAILFAGNANLYRHYKGIRDMYNTLKDIYEYTNRPYTILVLGDPNALPGIPVFGLPSKANLAAAFDQIHSLTNHYTDFIFYGTDHGGLDKGFVEEPPPPTDPGENYIDQLTLQPGLLTSILQSHATPQIVLQFDHLFGEGVHLFLNNFDIGDAFNLIDGEGFARFNIDPYLLGSLGDSFEIRITNGSRSAFRLLDGFFRSGEIDTLPLNYTLEIPSPVAACVLLPALTALRLRRRAA